MGQDLSRRRLLATVRRSRRRNPCSEPDRRRPDNPAIGHCAVSAFVRWEHLGHDLALAQRSVGGDLVLAQVFGGDDLALAQTSVGGEPIEHHDRNRFGGADLDVAPGQFDGSRESGHVGVHSGDEIAARCSSIQLELAARLAAFRARVTAGLDANSTPVVR